MLFLSVDKEDSRKQTAQLIRFACIHLFSFPFLITAIQTNLRKAFRILLQKGVLLAILAYLVLDGDGVLRHLRRINQFLLFGFRWRSCHRHDLVNSIDSIGLHIAI